ncbi:hypothetical protein ACS0TY_023319 [Phlomoides rotata]
MTGNKMDAPIGGGIEQEKFKSTRARRSWTMIEEDALIQCLLDIVSDGWKADNGFKAGFQRELEKVMRKLLPGTDIAATPHINSKIHVWKKRVRSSVSDLLSNSGIGWNSSTNTLDIQDEFVWDQRKGVIHISRPCDSRIGHIMSNGLIYLGRTGLLVKGC